MTPGSASSRPGGEKALTEDRAVRIRELVRATYEDPRVVARYVKVGLWPSEEILILDYVPDSGRILDLGCGAGRTSIALAEMGLEVVGVDLSRTMIEVARRQAGLAGVRIDFRTMDVTALQFPDASFQAAFFSYNGIELLPGRAAKRKALEEIGRVLEPGGTFIFSSHSLFALNSYAPYRFFALLKFCAGRFLGVPVRERELGERFLDDPREEVKYLQILTPSMWMKMLREAGFEPVFFNTRKRIEGGKPWRWWGIFEDGERFYVARRT